MRACPGAALVLVPERTDGVLALRSRAEGDAAVDHDIPEEDGQLVLEWQARGLRRRTFGFRAAPDTGAFLPERAVGGFQRAYGGPQMWSSEPLPDPDRAEQWLSLAWDEEQQLTETRVVFDDDIDEYLNNLHRHRTPFEVMPELVRDYRIQSREPDGTWRTVLTVEDNRRRHRVHPLNGADGSTPAYRCAAARGGRDARRAARARDRVQGVRRVGGTAKGPGEGCSTFTGPLRGVIQRTPSA